MLGCSRSVAAEQTLFYNKFMHNNELWQVYSNNGLPVIGKGASRDEFDADPNLIMGNAHVWFWRNNGMGVEIMLQKRSQNKSTRPGWYHISAGGHINLGESPVEAAVREVAEEMGIGIDTKKLHYVHSVRIVPRDPRDIVNVFLYRLNGDEELAHVDGEAESYEWRTLQNWKEITADAERHNLVPQGELYFGVLTKALELLAQA